ncbi:hypothetical protein EDD85DRAFT_941437 [Armillaria nabsnona]|nr:hypothetical protein EDD85DRAFT_941437 [Armillaria nabsnona]
MDDTWTKTMHVRQENTATMTTQRGREPPELYLSPITAFSTPSRASLVMPIYGGVQLTTTVPVRRHYLSNPDASYMEYVREYVPSLSPPVLGKPRHRHIPLPSQTECDTPMIMHPLLRPSRGEKMMELDFARSLSSVRVHGHEGCVKEVATSPPLPSLAIVHRKLPWPIVIQRSGDREWVTVADVVETLWHALQIRDPMRSPSPSVLENQDDAPCTSFRSMLGCAERGVVHEPRLAYLRGKTRFMGLHAIEGDTWELLVLRSTNKDNGLTLEEPSLSSFTHELNVEKPRYKVSWGFGEGEVGKGDQASPTEKTGDPGVREVLGWPSARWVMRQTNEPEQLSNIKGAGGRVVKLRGLQYEEEDENGA